jgi:DNA-binding NarL/FixJ family response regulator
MTQAMTSAPLRLVNVEDDPRYRASLVRLLHGLPQFVHVGSFASAEPLLVAARAAHDAGLGAPWDVVLTDLGLPGVDGAQLTRELKRLFPQLRVVALTVFDEPDAVLAAICAGADGYLLKSTPGEELIAQLQRVLDDGAPLSATLAGTMMRLVRESHAARAAELPCDLGLTPRQLDVLRGLVEGLAYRQVAQRLDISLDTVRSHVRQIYAAMQVHNVAEAVSYAIRHRLA